MLRTLIVVVLLAACGGSSTPPDLSVESRGAYQVGTSAFTLDDTARTRTFAAQVWYPSDASGAGFAVPMFEEDPNRTTYQGLLDAAPAACPSHDETATLDAAPATGTFPLLMMSHCHDCTRWSLFTIAERLASHGFVVVAVDHTDNTLWDQLDGTDVPLNKDFLPVREGDIRFALDQVLAGATPVPVAMVDATKIGVVGHSFGGVTAGMVAMNDPRIVSAFSLSAPMDNPLLAGVHIDQLTLPLGFLLAGEDNSITTIGNDLIRDNFTNAPDRAWKIEVADAGHWSWSDLVGVTDGFAPGCGQGVRQTDGNDFTYLDPEKGRSLAAAYVTAFFAATLEDDAGAEAYLTSGRGDGVIADSHP